MKNNRVGTIDISALNVPPEKHEYETAKYFANRSYDIVFIKPSNIKGSNSPDFIMKGMIWETKSPVGKSRRTFEDNFRKAIKQSPNIILDLRRLTTESETTCLRIIKRQAKTHTVKTVLIITRDGRLLTLKGKSDKL